MATIRSTRPVRTGRLGASHSVQAPCRVPATSWYEPPPGHAPGGSAASAANAGLARVPASATCSAVVSRPWLTTAARALPRYGLNIQSPSGPITTTWLVPVGPNRVSVTAGVTSGGDGAGAGRGRSAGLAGDGGTQPTNRSPGAPAPMHRCGE